MRHWLAGRRTARIRYASRYAGIILLIATGSFITACGVTDFLWGPASDPPPAAPTATPTTTALPTSTATPREKPTLAQTPIPRWTPVPESSPVPTSTPTPTAMPTLEPLEVRYLRDLAERWARTDTVRFKVEIDGKTYLDDGESIELRSAEGNLKRPDQAEASARVQIGFASFTVNLIVIGDDAYSTNVLTGRWERAPSSFEFNPALLFDDQRGIGAVLEELRDPQIAGRIKRGDRVYRIISGHVSQRDIDALVGGALEGDRIAVDVWMDIYTNELVRVSLSEPADGRRNPTTWHIDFSDHGKPVTITPPNL